MSDGTGGTPIRDVFGARLRIARRRKGWTRPQLEQKAGIPVNTLRQYEEGRSLPSAARLVTLAQVLEVDAGWLVPVERAGER